MFLMKKKEDDYPTHSEQGVTQLLHNHTRRLQKLKERYALSGKETPVDVSLEIEDIETEIKALQKELATLRESTRLPVPDVLPEALIPRQFLPDLLDLYQQTVSQKKGRLIF